MMMDGICDAIGGMLVQSRGVKIFLGAFGIVGWPLFLVFILLLLPSLLYMVVDCSSVCSQSRISTTILTYRNWAFSSQLP